MVMTSWVLWVSGGRPHPLVRRVKPGDGTSVMVAPGKNHSKQKRSVSMALFLTQNLFVASGIDLLLVKRLTLGILGQALTTREPCHGFGCGLGLGSWADGEMFIRS